VYIGIFEKPVLEFHYSESYCFQMPFCLCVCLPHRWCTTEWLCRNVLW